MQAATIATLKTSIDSMHDTIKQRSESDQNLVERNDNQMSSITQSLNETKNLIESIKKPSYANVVKQQRGHSQSGTPKSSKTPRGNGIPSLTGTSTKTIGKPPTPTQPRNQQKPRTERKRAEKAIWISNLHRNISEDEMLNYIRDDLGIKDDQVEVRKLVKKDRDISEYSFVSFCIMCSSNLFGTLMDVKNWPSYSRIREFSFNSHPPVVESLSKPGTPKNDQETSSVNKGQITPNQSTMDTSQVAH